MREIQYDKARRFCHNKFSKSSEDMDLSVDKAFFSGAETLLSVDEPEFSVDKTELSSAEAFLSVDKPELSSAEAYLSVDKPELSNAEAHLSVDKTISPYDKSIFSTTDSRFPIHDLRISPK